MMARRHQWRAAPVPAFLGVCGLCADGAVKVIMGHDADLMPGWDKGRPVCLTGYVCADCLVVLRDAERFLAAAGLEIAAGD